MSGSRSGKRPDAAETKTEARRLPGGDLIPSGRTLINRARYSASRDKDPFGVGSYLLGLRDRLRLAGWISAALDASASEKLADLSRLEADPEPLPPGLPDILARLVAELGLRAPPEPLEIQLAAPRPAFAPLVLALLDTLAAKGSHVLQAPPDAPLAPSRSPSRRASSG